MAHGIMGTFGNSSGGLDLFNCQLLDFDDMHQYLLMFLSATNIAKCTTMNNDDRDDGDTNDLVILHNTVILNDMI